MKKCHREHLELARSIVASKANIHVDPRGYHPRIIVNAGSKVVVITFPGSPSDSRNGLKNWVTRFRRRIRAAGLQTVA